MFTAEIFITSALMPINYSVPPSRLHPADCQEGWRCYIPLADPGQCCSHNPIISQSSSLYSATSLSPAVSPVRYAVVCVWLLSKSISRNPDIDHTTGSMYLLCDNWDYTHIGHSELLESKYFEVSVDHCFIFIFAHLGRTRHVPSTP